MLPLLRTASLIALFLLSPAVVAATDSVVTRKVEGEFHDVASSVREAILGKGINIAHVLPASQMLRRTGSSYGYTSDVYVNAETYEFCSAALSQKLSRLNPDNIVMCPFTISVYTVTGENGYVRLSYRIPSGKPGSDKVIGEIVELIESILDDATW
jgi:uncharacterized protein (DUF302 family)